MTHKKELPNGWREVELGNIATIISGSTPSTNKKEYWDGTINWITPAEIGNGHNWYYGDTQKKITQIGYNSCSTNIFHKETVMLTSRAPIGKVAIAANDMCSNQGFKNIICNPKYLNPEYLYFWLRTNKMYLNSLGRGATFKEISKSIIEKIKIPLPPLPTQKKIVAILEKAEKLKELRKEADARTDEFLKSVFSDLFLNESQFDKVKLGDITKIISGSTPSTSKEKYWNGDINWITPAELIDGENYYYLETKRKITKKGLNSCSSVLFPKETVMLTTRAPIGKVAIAGTEMCSNQGFKNIIPSNKINSIYLYYWLLLKKKYLNSLGRGATFKEISKTIVSNIEIPLPPIELQQKFASIVENIELMKENQKQSKQHIDDLFNALTQKAFKGELI